MVLYILIAILMFGLLIAVHEFGHFAAAKLLGVRVNEFAIGMGPLLWSRQKGETQYSLRAIPMGGFCAMEGEDDDSDDPRAFSSKPGWKKFIILVAGAFMNFLTGALLILLVFALGRRPAEPVVTSYMPGAESVAQSGILIGDELYRVDGHRVYFSSDAKMFLERAGDAVNIELIRNGEHLLLEGVYLPRLYPDVEDGKTVYKRGLQMGGTDAPIFLGTMVRNTWYQSIDYVRMVWMGLSDLVTGAVGLQDMSGPIGIVNIIGQAGEQGAQYAVAENESPVRWAAIGILDFVAFIAINLAVMNLLPIPALDGGRIFFLLVNWVFALFARRRLDPKYEGYVNMAGFLCLILLMVVVAVNDVMKLIG